MFLSNGEMEKRMFLSTWKDIPSSHEKSVPLEGLNNPTTDSLVEKFKRNNVFVIAQRNVENKDMVYMSLLLPRELWVLIELKVMGNQYNMAYKCCHLQLIQLVHESIDSIVRE